MIDTQTRKTSLSDLYSASALRQIRRDSGLTIAQFASEMGLQNRSSQTQYENGAKPISQRYARRLAAWRSEEQPRQVNAAYPIPPGTIVLGEVHVCECATCGVKFIRYNSRMRFHAPRCRVKAWREKGKVMTSC